nr:MAG TPA: hypothetical protein [Caudoviricetes sp.]
MPNCVQNRPSKAVRGREKPQLSEKRGLPL